MKPPQFTLRRLMSLLLIGGCMLGWWMREASIAGIVAVVVCAVLLYWVALSELVWPDR